MEGTNITLIIILLSVLGFGSALIHYTAYAKARAKAYSRPRKGKY